MKIYNRLGRALFALLGLAGVATSSLVASGCVIEPREGYYDREHHRWYHEHHWARYPTGTGSIPKQYHRSIEVAPDFTRPS